MNKIEQIIDTITEVANNSVNLPVILDPSEVTIGSVIRQGDVYLVAIEAVNVKTTNWKETEDPRQLAEGESAGSRHRVESDVTILKPENYGKIVQTMVEGQRCFMSIGPIIVADERFVVSHPEHCNFELPKGIYQVSYQVDSKTMRRVLD